MNYSTWGKWDLHLHSRASNFKCAKEYKGEGIAFTAKECMQFCNKIRNAHVDLVAITDHNFFNAEQFIRIKKDFCDLDGNALPGVELKVFYYLNEDNEVAYPTSDDTASFKKSKILHCVLIFNDDNVADSKIYHDIENIIETLYSDIDTVYIGQVVDTFLSNKFEFILIPHFEKHNDLESVVPDNRGGQRLVENMIAKTKWLVGGFFSGLDGNVYKIKQSKIKAIAYLMEKYEYHLPAIQTSDNHDFTIYDGDVSEYKALTTFNGLKLCFSDPSQRIRYDERNLEKDDFISEIQISSDDKYISSNIIEVSPYLNCIIGGRSSGKSLLIAMIGKSLGERTNNHINETQTGNYDKFLNRYNTFHERSTVKLLRPDGSIYDGKFDIYLQDSIIKRFESSESSFLAIDFRDEFNEDELINIDSHKEEVLVSLKGLIDNIDRLSIEYKSLKSLGNIITSFQMPKIDTSFIFYTNESEQINKANKTNADNLTLMKSSIEQFKSNFSETINKYDEIKEPFSTLISSITTKQKEVTQIYKKYNDILNMILSTKTIVSTNQNVSVRQHDVKRSGIISLVNQIAKYITLEKQNKSLLNKIKNFDEMDQESENTVGNYRFVVKYTSKITPLIILKILNNFRILISEKDDLDLFVESYIMQDEKWSHSRTSESIKGKIEDELKNYIKKEYQIFEEDELINEMSEGRKASVFIDILLNKDQNQYPIIIDQPEDNMDNQDISKRLVASLRSRKNNRQIFVVTHNPNVLINGDSENVIIASKSDGKVVSYSNSAIEYNDEFDMIKNICDLVEGGTNAFLKREKKYGLEATDISNYGGSND